MTSDKLRELIVDFQADMVSVLDSKGADYTRQTDRLSNFKTAGSDIGVSPMQAWYVFTKKHFDAIATYCRTGKVSSETIKSRLLDLANYAVLGVALVEESGHAAGKG